MTAVPYKVKAHRLLYHENEHADDKKQVLVDTAYETKRIRSVLETNMAARMSLESQRREELIVYNRELREKATALKTKVMNEVIIILWIVRGYCTSIRTEEDWYAKKIRETSRK